MHQTLFFPESDFFQLPLLRAEAGKRLRELPLLARAATGDLDAAITLHTGFWPFVREFEHVIDRQRLPRTPLAIRFPAMAPRELRAAITGIAASVAEMKAEEGSHALHWRKDAWALGIEVGDEPAAPAITELLARAQARDLPEFFAVLAGTEIVAEELSAFLVGSPAFTGLFTRQRWIWGEIHLAPHDGPSHLEIDLDLARAYSPSCQEAQVRVTTEVMRTIALFERAVQEIEAAGADRITLPQAA
jgi:hypothetical protein